MKASDVLVHLKKPSHKTGSVSELRHLWVTSLAQDHGQTFIHLTQKHVGQLSQFMNRCPSGSARDILRWTLAHWPQFSKECEAIHGAKNTPIIPQIGFLLIHVWRIAANLGRLNRDVAAKAGQ